MSDRPTTAPSTPSSALIAEKGFAEVTLRDVAAAAGLGLADLYRLYPDKVALAAAFMARIDAEVLAGTPRQIDPEETARDRLFDVMMRRYDALQPHRAALARDPPRRHARSDAGAGAGPGAAPLDGGDAGGGRRFPATGFTGAVRQNGLLAIHYAGLAGLRPRRNGRPLQDHGGPGQPPQDGGEMGATL